MSLLHTLKHFLRPSARTRRHPESDPAMAYDRWSIRYDDQPNNLMLALDERLFGGMLSAVPITGRVVADVGCGTGRHWRKLLDHSPARLAGYDVSTGMLTILRTKFPDAEIHLLHDHTLAGLGTASCDLLISTLTIAHLPDLRAALAEWNRVLKPGGHLLITDYHPAALGKGGQRTFREGDQLIAVRNRIYPIPKVLAVAHRLGLTEFSLVERKVDDTMRPWYEQQNALPVFRRFLGVPIIYGLHLTKPDAPQ
ncbi:MAG TPA: class I SAM-dependent methyltransferase [Puia sp.]|nr:class I SAM-dependent methyltransferase [Puia sp.]